MPEPTVDPRLATIATRLRALKVELDRLDDAISLLHKQDHHRLASWMFVLRDAADGLEQDVEAMAADGQPR